MSTLLPIAVSTRRMPAVTATAGQVQFPFTFPIVRPGDVRVRRTRGNVETELAYGSDYTVWGVNEPAGGTVTLTAGSLAGDLIVVEGDAALDRLSSVAVNGRFSSRQIDQEFNLSLMRDQELRRDLDATIGSAGMQERVEDLIGSSLLAGSGITVTYDAASGKTTLNVVGLAGGGSGNVVGPASSINGRIAVFSGVTGRLLADSGVTTASFAPASHTHTVAQITDFNSALVGVNDTNRILNPAMLINQSDVTSLSSGGYIADVWLASNITAASWTTNVPAGFPRSIEFTGSAFPSLAQRLEANSVLDLVGQQVTVSFWAQNVSGTTELRCDILTANALDNFTAITSHQSVNVSASPSTAWTLYSATFNALPAAAANGIELRILRGTGSASTTRVTGVQLVVGTSSTSFKFRPQTIERLLIQRQYFRIDVGTAGGLIHRAFNQANVALDVTVPFTLPVTMRAAPTLSARADINDGAAFTTWDALSISGGGPWVVIRKSNVPAFGWVDLQALTADARL